MTQTPSQLFGVESSRGSASNARSRSRISQSFRPSIFTGFGILPSATNSSNLLAEMPTYIAASVLDRPRRGTGRTSDRARAVIVPTRSMKSAKAPIWPVRGSMRMHPTLDFFSPMALTERVTSCCRNAEVRRPPPLQSWLLGASTTGVDNWVTYRGMSCRRQLSTPLSHRPSPHRDGSAIGM